MVIRGHHELDAALHRLLEEAAEDHRVGDVGDVEFIEADEAVALRGALGHRGDRVLGALELVELAMDLAHEVVEVHAALAHQRHAQVERVHQEALAAPDRAPQVHPLGQRRLHQQPLQGRASLLLVLGPFLVQLLQALHRAPLGRIGNEAAALEALLVDRDDVLAQMLSERLSTPSAASFRASDSEGCACTIMPISSAEPRNSIATTASAISSPAIGPMMCTPRISSVFSLARNFTRPLVSPNARARALAENGNTPARYAMPSAFNCCSVLPTQAISGLV